MADISMSALGLGKNEVLQWDAVILVVGKARQWNIWKSMTEEQRSQQAKELVKLLQLFFDKPLIDKMWDMIIVLIQLPFLG